MNFPGGLPANTNFLLVVEATDGSEAQEPQRPTAETSDRPLFVKEVQ